MKNLSKAEQKKVIKARNLITEAIELLKQVNSSSDEFRYDSNNTILFNGVLSSKGILKDMTNEFVYQERISKI